MSIPSLTSSSAFSAAARFSSSLKRIANRFDARGDAALVPEDRVAGNQDRRPRRDDEWRGVRVDATVDLDLDLRRQPTQAPDLVRAALDELLAAEPRLDRHHVDQVDVWQYLAQVFDRRRRVDGHTCLRAKLLDRLHCPVERTRSLHLYLDQSRSRFGKRLQEHLRSLDHQVGFDGQRRRPADRLHRMRPESEVGHEVAVHDIDLDPVGARGLRLLDLFGEAPDVGRKDRRNNLDLPHLWGSTRRSRGMGLALRRSPPPHQWGGPAAARSISHRALAIIPDGDSPRLAMATAPALPAPVAMISTFRASRIASSVIVTRCAGGFGESWTPAVRPVAFSALWPGKSELTWPSSPTPKNTKSNGATFATTSAYRSAPSSGPSSAGIR